MAYKVGSQLMSVGTLDETHTSARNPILTRVFDDAGNQYVYLQGVASCAIGSWVTYDELGVTALAVAAGTGRVGIAMAATTAGLYGWFCIWGTAPGLALTGYVDNRKVWLTSTPGSVDDTDVATDLVDRAIGRSAVNETSFLATFELAYPVCLHEVKN